MRERKGYVGDGYSADTENPLAEGVGHINPNTPHESYPGGTTADHAIRCAVCDIPIIDYTAITVCPFCGQKNFMGDR